MANENVKPVTEEMLKEENTSEEKEKTTPKAESKKQVKNTPDETSTDEGKESGKNKGLSQEKVNELVGQARTEGRESAAKELLESLGVESQDNLQAMLDEYNEMKRGQMSALERLETDLEAERKAKEKLSDSAEKAKSRAAEALLRAEVARLASGKFADVDVVLKIMEPQDIEINLDEGTVTGVEKSLDALAEQYPWMLSKTSKVSQTSTTNPANPNRKTGKTDDQRTAEYFGRQGSDFWGGSGVRIISGEDE
jgi:hypothetical protein